MNATTTIQPPTTSPHRRPIDHPSPLRRFFGVVAEPRSYRNLAYLLLGLPLGTLWFTAVVTGASVGFSMVIVMLLGLPILLGLWYAIRGFANVERHVANVLLDEEIPLQPMASEHTGNIWVRLRSMSRDRDRWQELSFLMLRFPAGIATFTAAATAFTSAVMVGLAPVMARNEAHPFGDWTLSSTMEDIASSSPWSWFLVPLGVLLVFVSFHLVNAIAKVSGRWAATALRPSHR